MTDDDTAIPDFDGVFRAEFDRVVNVVRFITGDSESAHDVTQESFARLFVHWPKVSRYDDVGAWLRRVAIREASRRGRRRAQAAIAERRAFESVTATRSEPTSAEVDGALLRLPMKQRAAVVLHYFEDRSTDEVADILGCQSSTARVHLHRARVALAEYLGVDDTDDRKESSDVR